MDKQQLYWNLLKAKSQCQSGLIGEKFPAFVTKYGEKQLKVAGLEVKLYLQPISSIHTTTGFEHPGIGKPVSPTFLAILALIAALIQIIACINFMNLSTARSSKRAKEVGVRKVIGAGRNDLVRQFLGESFLLSLISVMIALPLLVMALPLLNQITQSDIQISFLKDFRVWLMLFSLVFITGLVAGSYPAFYLSAFRVIKVIKGNFTNEISATGIRRSLVVFQFVLSIVLITGITIIYSQLNFIKNKDLGFDKDQRLIFTFNSGESFEKIPSFMEDVRKLSGVKEVSNASKYISNPALFSNVFTLPGQASLKQNMPALSLAMNFCKSEWDQIDQRQGFPGR
jgi:putative ABC transport system permease protein